MNVILKYASGKHNTHSPYYCNKMLTYASRRHQDWHTPLSIMKIQKNSSYKKSNNTK